MISLTINDQTFEVPEGYTVLQAAESIGIIIPTLCHHKDLSPFGGCRLCVGRGARRAPAHDLLHSAGSARRLVVRTEFRAGDPLPPRHPAHAALQLLRRRLQALQRHSISTRITSLPSGRVL